MILWLVATASLVAAAATSWRVSRADVRVRPVAVTLLFALAANVGRLTIQVLVLRPFRATTADPYTGLVRAFFHVEQALLIGSIFAVPALVWHVVAGETAAPVALGLAALFALVSTYPTLRGPSLETAYLVCTVVAAIVGGLAVLSRRRKHANKRPLTCSLVLLAGLAAELLGPYVGSPITHWWTAQITWTIAFWIVVVTLRRRAPWEISRG